MSRRLVVFAWLAVCLSACAKAPGTPTATPPATATPTPLARFAMLSELKNQVQAHTNAAEAWQAATEGQTLHVKGGAKTLADSRVRIDFSDGTLLRLGTDTEFTLADLSPAATNPVTRLQLAAGQLWVSVTKALGTGSFEVDTPVGVAGVRGSTMSVAYRPATGLMVVTCVEGACYVALPAGQPVTLAAGQQSEIANNGQPPAAAHAITAAELADWSQSFPEAATVVAALTPATPTASPSPSATATLTPSSTPTVTPTPDVTATPSPSPTFTPKPTSTRAPTSAAPPTLAVTPTPAAPPTSAGGVYTFSSTCDADTVNVIHPSFAWSVDGAQVATTQCNETANATLGPGDHTFQVCMTDAGGTNCHVPAISGNTVSTSMTKAP